MEGCQGDKFIQEVKQHTDFTSILNWHLSEFMRDL